MQNFLSVLCRAGLFEGVAEAELPALLSCLGTRRASFPKDAFLLRAGDAAGAIGLVLAGRVLVVQEDLWGNRSLVSRSEPGQTFAAAFACAPGAALTVSAVAETPVTALFLDVSRVLTVCPAACPHHNRVIRNLLGELAGKTLRVNEKLTHMSQRTTRARLLSYLSAEARRQGARCFDIPFSRQQLADYLVVERSGLSRELCRLRDEGLLSFRRNHFELHV